ncbi:MAG: TetR/AcrR family transcriptional regulator [Christensenellaceae bacterium]
MNDNIVFKNDARSVKTRNAIKRALLKLLKSKNITEIGVGELTSIAERNRNSFYTHYKCVDDVLTDVTRDVIFSLNKVIRKFTFKEFLIKPKPLLAEVGKFISSHKRSASVYMRLTCMNDIVDEIKRKFTDQIVNCSIMQFGLDFKPVRYAVSFFVSGAIEVYKNWLTQSDMTINEITEVLVSFVDFGFGKIKSGLGLAEN